MNKISGYLAEEIAVEFLKKQGYKIIERNWKLKNFGEIDIISQKKKILNFVEVKSLKEDENFEPEYHFNKKKFNKIKKLASFYALRKNFDNWIISLIAVLFKEKPEINYYENIQI